ncbi:hypothetical protein FHG87_016838 [Trinorchestia longiramus]|nr:hypothetical protein FHG87_016838 [Trinorchestia longiramus]
MNYDIPVEKTIQNVVTLLQAHTSACVDTEKEKELVFLTRQLEILSKKQFSMNDYYFTLQSYPKCDYEQLRHFLVLTCKRKLQYITSSIDKDQVLRKIFDKVQTLQQKNVILLVNAVQIRPTLSFSGGVLSDMAENNRDCKATSMLWTRQRNHNHNLQTIHMINHLIRHPSLGTHSIESKNKQTSNNSKQSSKDHYRIHINLTHSTHTSRNTSVHHPITPRHERNTIPSLRYQQPIQSLSLHFVSQSRTKRNHKHTALIPHRPSTHSPLRATREHGMGRKSKHHKTHTHYIHTQST